MKYLFLIIRHMFHRKRWTLVRESNLVLDNKVVGRHRLLRDQFGNLKDHVFYL